MDRTVESTNQIRNLKPIEILVTHLRTFRNSDPPALAELWNKALVGLVWGSAALPLSPHELDQEVMGKLCFDPRGLIVAERDGRVVGWAHAVFGPDRVEEDVHQVSRQMGAVAMLVVDPEADDGLVGFQLLAEGERYLKDRGATVLYAGGQSPLNPFYWGLYGGSEWAGILGSHHAFEQLVSQAGYQAVSDTILLESQLNRYVDPRVPRWALLRRQTRLEIRDDPPPSAPWNEMAIGSFFPVRFELVNKSDDRVLARATTWDMEWFSRQDDRPRIGLIEFSVEPEHRRQGLGKLLVSEILQTAKSGRRDCRASNPRHESCGDWALRSHGFYEN